MNKKMIILGMAIITITAISAVALPDTITCRFDGMVFDCTDNNVYVSMEEAEAHFAALNPAYVPIDPPITFQVTGGTTETLSGQ